VCFACLRSRWTCYINDVIRPWFECLDLNEKLYFFQANGGCGKTLARMRGGVGRRRFGSESSSNCAGIGIEASK